MNWSNFDVVLPAVENDCCFSRLVMSSFGEFLADFDEFVSALD